MRMIDLTGRRFGRLSVIKKAENIGSHVAWLCKCDCGNEKVVKAGTLLNGETRSCGCYKMDVLRKSKTIHGDCRTRLYVIWLNMHRRCVNSNERDYKWYGAKGIKVCNEWSKYETFRDWANVNGYSDLLTIDRLDSNKNYCPENCRWIPLEDNIRMAREKHILCINGRKMNLNQWSAETGIAYNVLYSYVRRNKADIACKKIMDCLAVAHV